MLDRVTEGKFIAGREEGGGGLETPLELDWFQVRP